MPSSHRAPAVTFAQVAGSIDSQIHFSEVLFNIDFIAVDPATSRKDDEREPLILRLRERMTTEGTVDPATLCRMARWDGKVGGFTAIKARSNNPPLEGGSKLLAISGRGRKTSYNSIPNVVENITYPALHRQFIGSATIPGRGGLLDRAFIAVKPPLSSPSHSPQPSPSHKLQGP